MFDVLAGIFASGPPILFGRRGRRGRPQDAYRKAWKYATSTGDWTKSVLRSNLKNEGVRGCYDDESSPKVSILFDLWEERVPPEKANDMLGKYFARR